MADVYAWPPVAVQARYWTMEQPIGRSRSLITGGSYVSAAQRKRIVAGFDIVGWPKYSAGYLEALWRYLDGGLHLVRLTSCRIPYGRTNRGDNRTGFDWQSGGSEFGWTVPPAEITWIHGTQWTFTTQPRNRIRVTGLPQNSVVAIPGEFVTVTVDGVRDTIMVVAEAVSDETGAAIISLIRAASGAGTVTIGTHETGVFELVSAWPRVMNRNRFPENYAIEFREVFSDERGPFLEIDPWN